MKNHRDSIKLSQGIQNNRVKLTGRQKSQRGNCSDIKGIPRKILTGLKSKKEESSKSNTPVLWVVFHLSIAELYRQGEVSRRYFP